MKKCLDKEPQKRYTFEEIVAKLTELQQTEDSILKEQHYTKIQLLNPVITEPGSQVESKIVADLKKDGVIDTKLGDKIELIVNGNENCPNDVSYSFLHILLMSKPLPWFESLDKNHFWYNKFTKGQLIPKGLFGNFNSPKKRMLNIAKFLQK